MRFGNTGQPMPACAGILQAPLRTAMVTAGSRKTRARSTRAGGGLTLSLRWNYRIMALALMMACYLLLASAFNYAQLRYPFKIPVQERLPGAMQSQVMDRPISAPETSGTAGAERLRRKTVVSTHRDVLVCLDMRRVVGCVQVEKLTRLPGSHDMIAGILLFRGRPVPLVSVRRHSGRRRNHKKRTEEHALVVSARGREFALRVDDVPKIVEGPLPYELYSGRPCVMRTKHVERFLELCALSGNEPIDRSTVPGCRRAG